jgi:hypothetical protein
MAISTQITAIKAENFNIGFQDKRQLFRLKLEKRVNLIFFQRVKLIFFSNEYKNNANKVVYKQHCIVHLGRD